MYVNVTNNFTYTEGTNSIVFPPSQIVSLTLLALLIVAIIAGNGLVIFTFFSNGHKIKTVTNYFIVSLAVSDILVGTFSIPYWMWVMSSWQMPRLWAHIYTALDILCGGASIFNLSAVTLERLYAVVRPASHRNLKRKKNIIHAVIATVWLLALINSALYFVKVYFDWVHYTVYAFMINFAVPAIIILISYIVIFRVVKCNGTEKEHIEQEIKLASMIAIVIALFILCWLPFFLLNLLYTYCTEPSCSIRLMKQAIPYVKILHYSNSMMNPLVYAFRNSDYRKAFTRYLRYVLNKFRNTRYRNSNSSCHEAIEMGTTVSYRKQQISLLRPHNMNIGRSHSI